MSGPHPPFDGHDGQRAALEQVALAVTAAEVGDRGGDTLVLALWPDDDRRRVIASPGSSAIRAAISVAVAAGNTRSWSDVPDGAIVDLPVIALPEIIRASVAPCGVRTIQVGAIRAGDRAICFSMWLSPSTTIADVDHARHAAVLSQLRAGDDADRARSEEAARQAAADAAARAAQLGDRDAVRSVPDGPGAAAALPDRDHFDRTIEALDCEEAAVLVIGIDDSRTIESEHGSDALVATRDAVASRLAGSVRKHDVVAYVGDDTFAVVLVNVDRHTAFDISRRLRGALSEPLVDGSGPGAVSVSVGLSYESGLIEPVEMYEAAWSAMVDARSEGGARMLIAC